MKLRFLVVCFALVVMTNAARAQVGLYVNPIGIHVSNSTKDTGPFAFLGQNTTSRWFWGASIGGYYTLKSAPKWTAALDLRDQVSKGNNATLNSFLVGVRLAAKPIRSGFKPYAEIAGGAITTKPPTSSAHLSRGAFAVYGGVDYEFSNHVDFRAIEVGYGTGTTANSGAFGGTLNQPASKMVSITTGLVFHFHAPTPF